MSQLQHVVIGFSIENSLFSLNLDD